MKNQIGIKRNLTLVLIAMMVWLCGTFASAESLSGDNSLASLGIMTEGTVVSPDFYYSTIEYNVTVPAGTEVLSLDPVTSNSNATIESIWGTELVNGSTTVEITVVAQNGTACTYYLYVEAEEEAEIETEPVTEAQTETEPETEDPRYIRVPRETLEDAENTIETLKTETDSYRERVNFLMIILYVLIAVCVILLFVIINLILRRNDLKKQLASYRSAGYPSGGNTGNKKEEKPDKKKSKDKRSGKQEAGTEDTVHAEYEPFGDYYEDYEDRQSETDQPKSSSGNDDDPSTVPKPQDAKKQTKRMPEYEQPKEKTKYKPPKDPGPDGGNVDVDYIDL